MANATPSRIGLVNASGTNVKELFLKVFAGEVLTAFNETNIMQGLTMNRTITSGKSAQFPVMWKAAADYHTAGSELIGANAIKHQEKVINIDEMLISDAFIHELDEAMNHYDVRSEYSKQLGEALALRYDKNVLQTIILAARASSNFSSPDGFGGTTITDAGNDTSGATLASSLFTAAQTLDEKDVPETERYCVLRPKNYYLLASTTDVINKDWDGAGSYSKGKVMEVAGITIFKSNNVPQSVINGNTGENNTYSGTFSDVVGAVFHPSCVGTVKLRDLKMEMEYDIRRQGTLMLGKYAMGHGILRPESAIEISK